MTYADNEFGAVVQSATNYYFEDDESEPICFSVLPIKWSESEMPAFVKEHVYLSGITDSGSEKIYKRVVAWKIEFLYEQPKVSVLSQEKSWIRLQKPRKSFEDTIRTILITIHCLHFVKRHPDTSESSLWSHLQKKFGFLKVKPSLHDLLCHRPLIQSAVKRDKTFSKSEVMLTILNQTDKRKVLDQDIDHEKVVKKTKLTTEIDKEFDRETVTTSGDEPLEVWDLCDDVCALCDNGGDLLCCEGRCLRSFHATVDTGFASGCKSLALSEDQLKEKNFFCENCQYKQHQCFACGKLGSSDISHNPEVFRCSSMTCGHFYHPECVAKLLHPINYSAAEEIQKKIIAGHSFTCTVHKCSVCKKEEDKGDADMQFAICRRCPKVYHRKCLPREIGTESLLDQGILQRAWKDLLPDRILIYCLKHKIDSHTLTPERNHIIFPNVQGKKRLCSPALQPIKRKVVTTKTNLNARNHAKKDPVQVVKEPGAMKTHDATKIHAAKQASKGSFDSKKRFHVIDTSRSSFNFVKLDKTSALDDVNAHMRKGSLNQVPNKRLELGNSRRQGAPCSKSKLLTVEHVRPVTKKSCSYPHSVITEVEARLQSHNNTICGKVDLMNERPSPGSTGLDAERHRKPSSQTNVDEIIASERVGGSVQAAEACAQKLQDNNFDDLKACYEPEIFDYQTKLKVVDKLLCYAQTGDTIVNFCCDDNEFSHLMQQNLTEIGKKCPVKNYEFKAESDFDKEDWPTASRLIIGLICPGGMGRGVSVDEFIDKVLDYKSPKLLLLVRPRETKRLDENETGYSLLWENEHTCETQVVYLWSRSDWSVFHRKIALAEGHIALNNKDDEIRMNEFTDVTITTQISNLCEESETTEEEVLHFVQGPLISYLNGSCGWLDD